MFNLHNYKVSLKIITILLHVSVRTSYLCTVLCMINMLSFINDIITFPEMREYLSKMQNIRKTQALHSPTVKFQ